MGLSAINQIRVAAKAAEKTLDQRFLDQALISAKREEYKVTLEVAEANVRTGEDVADILEYFQEEAKVRHGRRKP